MQHVGFENVIQLLRNVLVEDERIRFVIISQAAAVQVGCTHGTEQVVHHHDFRVMKSAVVQIDHCPFFHQFLYGIERSIRCERDVGFGRNHNFHFRPPVQSPFECLADG